MDCSYHPSGTYMTDCRLCSSPLVRPLTPSLMQAIPNQQVLGQLERALGVKLRGKQIGQPLGGPKKKK